MTRPAAPLFLLLSLCAGANAASAQSPQPALIAGVVVEAGGRPAAGAEVTLQAGPAAAPRTATADEAGTFRFANVEPGEYTLLATAIGLSPSVHTLQAAAGATVELTMVMPQIVLERVNVVGDASLVDRIPGSAHVVDAPEMERLKTATDDIHQMLRQVPGMNIQEEDGYGLRPNIGMRGTGTERSSKITMMEDGVLIAPAPYAAPAAYYAPTPGRMEALEVRKGSSQIKYGPITTGGVLNYVSSRIPSAFQLRSGVTAGGDNTRRITAALGDSFRNFGWLVETYQFHTDGFKRLDGGGETGVDLADYLAKFRVNSTPGDPRYQELEVKLGRTEQVGDETYLGLTDGDFLAAPLRRYAASQLDRLDAGHEQYQARHFIAGRNWDLTTLGYRNNFHRAWYKLDSVMGSGLAGVLRAPEANAARLDVLRGGDSAPNALIVRNNNRTYYGAGVQSVLGVSLGRGTVRHQVEAGVRYHQDEEDRFQQDDGYQMLNGRMIQTRAGAPGSQSNQINGAAALAGFVSDTIAWGRWTVSPGLRYETISLERTSYARTDPDRAGAATSLETRVDAVIPGAGFSYTASPNASLFGGVHRGFAPPGPGAAAGTRVEHSVNYELGGRARHGAATAEVVGFFNAYGNLLGRDTLASGGSGEGDLFNGGQARIYGLESSLHWDAAGAIGSTASVPLRLAYTFTHAEFRNSFDSQFDPWGDVRAGDELPYVPRHQLYASVGAERQNWRTRFEGIYVGRMRTLAGQGGFLPTESTDSYLVLNLSGELSLRDGAWLFASVQNLLDSTRVVARHPSGVRPGLPRLVQAGLKVDLGR